MHLGPLVLGSITLLIQFYADKYRNDDLAKTLDELEDDLNLPRIKTFDFIVVGGGTGGSLLAGRLSEKFNVLLLEAGGPTPPAVSNPYLVDYVHTHSAINAALNAQKMSSQDPIVKVLTGRMLGGSGSHNSNIYNRGSPYDYDNLANLTGDPTWSYASVLKHFKNFENFVGPLTNESEREEFYGTGGPLTVQMDSPPILSAWIQAADELGFGYFDANGNQREGFAPVTRSIKNGWDRHSTYTAYVQPFEKTRNTLTVVTYSVVDQVLINDENVAYGVQYRRHGIPQIAHASKEVIISAGVYISPMLLIKSGVGPKESLNDAQIPIKKELPGVGQNLHEHVAVVLNYLVNKVNTTLIPRIDDLQFQSELEKFQSTQKREGFLTTSGTRPIAQAYLISSRVMAETSLHWPDLQFELRTSPIIGEGEQTAAISVALNRAKSIGRIVFDAIAYANGERDDENLTLIDFRILSDPSDALVLIEGIKFAIKIMEETTPFKAMEMTATDSIPNECQSLAFRSDEFWECNIRQRPPYIWNHAVGTCKMGNILQDPWAVVDSKLRVTGISKLRVIDASVLPATPNTNVNAAIILVAEKGAHEILSEYDGEANRSVTTLPVSLPVISMIFVTLISVYL